MIDLPTIRAGWSGAGPEVRRTLADPGPLAVAVIVGLVVALLASASRRVQFVLDTLASGSLSVWFKAEFLLLHLPGLGAPGGALGAIVIVAVAAIAGITAGMLSRAIVSGRESTSDPSARDAGIAIGCLGVVTAAVGPAMLAGIAGLVAADGALAALPLGGLEGSLLAVPALALSTYWLAGGLGGDGDGGDSTDTEDR